MDYSEEVQKCRETHKKRRKRLKDLNLKTTEEENGVLQTSPKGELNSGITEKIHTNAGLTIPERFQKWTIKTNILNPYTKYYAITVSPHGRYAEKEVVYNSMLSLFSMYKGLTSALYIFERLTKGKWHTHGLLAMKDKCKFAKVRKHPLVKYHIEEYVPGNWIDYISKDLPSEIYQINHYKGSKIESQTHDIRNYIDWSP